MFFAGEFTFWASISGLGKLFFGPLDFFLNPQISHIHSGAAPSCIPLSSCKAPKRIKCFWPADDLPFLAETVAVTVELLNPREHKLDCFCSSMVMH